MPALVDSQLCEGCEDCVDSCPVEAIEMVDEKAVVDADECTECSACLDTCTSDAISMVDED